MPRSGPTYPYVPRSNARLLAGELWSIPLPNGEFACGAVLGVARDPQGAIFAPSNRAFVGGLLDWHGTVPPTPDAVAGAQVIEQGVVHVKTIAATGGAILGRAAGIEPLTWRSGAGQDGGWVYRGIERLRPAAGEDLGLRLITALGYGYFREMASRRAGLPRKREPLEGDR